jgi:hypothetical protein
LLFKLKFLWSIVDGKETKPVSLIVEAITLPIVGVGSKSNWNEGYILHLGLLTTFKLIM